MLVHSFGLRAHDEAEEVLVWYSGAPDRRRGEGAALVIQTGALREEEADLSVFLVTNLLLFYFPDFFVYNIWLDDVPGT